MEFPLETHLTQNLDEHVALIQGQMDKSVHDPELRQLAVKIVSGKYDYMTHPRTGRVIPVIRAWDQTFLAPENETPCEPRDERCEIERIWDFTVANVRYVYDPDEIDFFATSRATLEAGGGDCDDLTILINSLGKAIGFKTVARVISTQDDPDDWVHIYPMLGMNTKDAPSIWIPMDTTVKGSVPGWQYEDIAKHRDYVM